MFCRRLLEKYSQYQEQVAQLQAREREGEEQEEEMEDILTPDEKNTAQRVKKTIDKYAVSTGGQMNAFWLLMHFLCRLEQGELQLDETVMVLSNYIRMVV